MTAVTDAIVRAYTAYVSARKTAKQEAKAELAVKMQPHLVTLGESIENAQLAGTTISEVARAMGVQYRNLIYDAKRAYAEHKGVQPNVKKVNIKPKPQPEPQPEPDEAVSYTITRLDGGGVELTLYGEDIYLEVDEDSGRVIFPESWAYGTPDERALYKKIIREVEAG